MGASGSVTVTATLSLPVSLNVGIEVIPIAQKRTFSLLETPSLIGTVKAAGSVGGSDPESEDCNNGVAYSLRIQNDVLLDVFGVTTVPLSQIGRDLAKDCFQLPEGSTDTVNEFFNDGTIASFAPEPGQANPDGGVAVSGLNGQVNSAEIADLQSAGQDASTQSQSAPPRYRSSIVDSMGAYAVAAGADGNLYAGPADTGSSFILSDVSTGTDLIGRVFFYQPDTMDSFSVSRIRLVDRASVPRGAQMIVLKTFGEGSDAVLRAVTTTKEVL
jgi:hypothetical protein